MTDQPDSWLRTQLRTKQAEIGDLRHRLGATERHTRDLHQANENLRERIASLEADNAILRSQLHEAAAVMDLLPAAEGPVWQP